LLKKEKKAKEKRVRHSADFCDEMWKRTCCGASFLLQEKCKYFASKNEALLFGENMV